MRMIAYKGEGGLILATFVSTYYVDDPHHKASIVKQLAADDILFFISMLKLFLVN